MQRGTFENTNGLLRQFMPKHRPELFSQDELDGIADSMNNRPRAKHDGQPLEVFAQTLASHEPPASIQQLPLRFTLETAPQRTQRMPTLTPHGSVPPSHAAV
ncbi:hypothetical protein [Variovorax rhizosphaerae]|uniref:hypothetical protein n=1 Tax=Variovorax rhizosphaerae TaxID=1836200 RepID=UPI003BF4CE30